MNYSVVKTIDPLHKSYQKIQELYLNHNLIKSLTGIEQFTDLRVFQIKFNFIADLNEFLKIKSKSILCSLNFLGNPAEGQLINNPEFLNNFPNLRYFNTSKEASMFLENSLNNSKIQTVSKRLHFVDLNKEEDDDEEEGLSDGQMTGNFYIKKEIYEDDVDNFEDDISNIDHDISRLSIIFYEKLLKEKAILGLKRYFLQSYYRNSKFCIEFYIKLLKNRAFYYWRKAFINKILLKTHKKNLHLLNENIESKLSILSEEISTSSMTFRTKKQSESADLKKITETDQDFIDSNRKGNSGFKVKNEKIESKEEIIEKNILRENISKNNEENTKIGFSEYMKQKVVLCGKKEEGHEENYRHDLPLSSSFSSKCPYGSV